MKYISTRGLAPKLNFEEALLAGLATDGGLYVPETWPTLDLDTIADFKGKPYTYVAEKVLSPFIGDSVEPDILHDIIVKAYSSFQGPEVAPLVQMKDNHHLLELFHGPTLAFKDVAMQLLALLMDHALVRRGRRATIVGATSGDTGGAAIEAFRGSKATDIFILYPKGRVSDVQRKQMTTPDEANVHTIAIDGNFDDCQALVKGMFNHTEFRDGVGLAGVNSINWARVMAQTVYYFTAAVALGGPERAIAFSVPTGNFGDIFAGYVAKSMGLPTAQLMIATNVNDILARLLDTGSYAIGEVVATTSPSMDIQVSSNFERLLFEITGRDGAKVRNYMEQLKEQKAFTLSDDELAQMRSLFSACRIDQAHTAEIIRREHDRCSMVLDPHTAVGLGAAETLELGDTPIVTLATAHPAKFPTAVEAACGVYPDPPAHIAAMLDRPERSEDLPNDLTIVEDHIRAQLAASNGKSA